MPDQIRHLSHQLHRSLAIRSSAATARLRGALRKGPPRCAVANANNWFGYLILSIRLLNTEYALK